MNGAIDANSSAPPDTDFRGSKRLTGAAEWFWYIVAAVSYISLGMWHKWLLDWIIGPMWLVTVVCIGPAVVDRARTRFSRRGP
jgi:hypothetical protein